MATDLTSSTINSTKPDLTTEPGVLKYLSGSPFAGKDISTLTGGSGNYTFRITLQERYEGVQTVVIKHARPYAKVVQSITLDLIRQRYEVEALRRVKKWLPSDAIVTVPSVYKFDEEAQVIIMEDCGEESVDLKTFMFNNTPSPETSKRIGSVLGKFLGELHTWGRDADLVEVFEGNAHAKKLSAIMYYGELLRTINGDEKLPKLIDPHLEVSEEDIQVIKKAVEEVTAAMISTKETLVMGDLWPGNMMVTLNRQKELDHIYILDWELVRPGLTGVELGQFCAEIYMLQRFKEQCKETAPAVLKGFLQQYAERTHPNESVCRRAIAHLGVHMVVLGPRLEWGEKEITQEVVKEGIEFIVGGYNGSRGWLEKSLIGPLL